MTSKNTNCNDKRAREDVLQAVLLGEKPAMPARRHMEECASCTGELEQFTATLALLDEWHEPEPSPYFNTRLQARLRAEMEEPISLWDRLVARGMHGWRPAVAGALGLALVAGGMFMGISSPAPKSKSAQCAVVDLQILDRNADVLMEMNSIDDSGTQNP